VKKRILFSGEASWLSTGFSIYNHELIKRIFAKDKYIIAEYGAYGNDSSPQAKELPWKFYGSLPKTKEEERIYKSNKFNQFGVYKFDAVVAAFQPDIVVDTRDPWMLRHIQSSRFRDNYKTLLIPTVDSAPQKRDWIDNIFKKTDALCTYSRFGKRTLEGEGLKIEAVASPGVNLDIFTPMDKNKIRSDWGLKKGLRIIGTVMRNQRRKLFPDLFKAYSLLRKKFPKVREVKKSVLLCHTSWPDLGWDIPELLKRTGILRHVIFTYKCDSCKQIFFSWFLPSDSKGNGKCVFCGKPTAHMPSTHSGVTTKELAEIYNLMDIYIQPAICEGWGLPIVEAKACGVPGLYSNYSAMEDHCENGGGLPIKIDRMYTEPETMADRSLPDHEDMVFKIKKLLVNNKERDKLGKKAREVAEKFHHWDITANKVDKILDSMQIHDRNKTWDIRTNLKILPKVSPGPQTSNEQFIVWCYKSILNREPDRKGFNDWMNSLANGTSRKEVESFFRNQLDTHNKFEDVRWKHSLEIRGLDEQNKIEFLSNRIPGVII